MPASYEAGRDVEIVNLDRAKELDRRRVKRFGSD
jgi:hypothetical protein